MLVRLIAVGRVKKAALREMCVEYERRIRRYAKFEVSEVRDARRADRHAEVARKVEGGAILEAIPPHSTVIALSRTGVEYDSTAFASRIEKWRHEVRDVTFVIGGAHGLDQGVIDRSAHCVRLSAMTLPHELARLLLLEQIYRGFTILRGEAYHKGG